MSHKNSYIFPTGSNNRLNLDKSQNSEYWFWKYSVLPTEKAIKIFIPSFLAYLTICRTNLSLVNTKINAGLYSIVDSGDTISWCLNPIKIQDFEWWISKHCSSLGKLSQYNIFTCIWLSWINIKKNIDIVYTYLWYLNLELIVRTLFYWMNYT